MKIYENKAECYFTNKHTVLDQKPNYLGNISSRTGYFISKLLASIRNVSATQGLWLARVKKVTLCWKKLFRI